MLKADSTIERHTAPLMTSPIRLSDYLVEVFLTVPTRKGIKKAIKKGLVLVNGEVGTTGYWVQTGDEIALLAEEVAVKKVFPLELPVVYEDEYLAVVHKPSGYPVSGNYYKTIQNALPHNLKPSPLRDAFIQPQVAHRLDAPTSGLLVVAKNRATRVTLGRMFEAHRIYKTYHAVAMGKVAQSGRVHISLAGKKSVTHFNTLQVKRSLKSDWLSLIKIRLETGRMHQIRRHLSAIGHPILGDALYGTEGHILKGKGLFLCATGLALAHPVTALPLTFSIELPTKFLKTIEREQARWETYQ